jgi:hypothetical protein
MFYSHHYDLVNRNWDDTDNKVNRNWDDTDNKVNRNWDDTDNNGYVLFLVVLSFVL